MEGLDFEAASMPQLPKGHAAKEAKDFDKCPFAKTAQKKQEKPAKKEDAKDSDSEEEAPMGGCPVMTNDKNKNPDLAPLKSNFK